MCHFQSHGRGSDASSLGPGPIATSIFFLLQLVEDAEETLSPYIVNILIPVSFTLILNITLITIDTGNVNPRSGNCEVHQYGKGGAPLQPRDDNVFKLGLARLLPFQTKSDAIDEVFRASIDVYLILLPWPERHAIPLPLVTV